MGNVRLAAIFSLVLFSALTLSGCDRPNPLAKTTTKPSSSPVSQNKPRSKPQSRPLSKPKTTASNAKTPPAASVPLPAIEASPDPTPSQVSRVLSEVEQKELAALVKWCSSPDRDREVNPGYCRQRPVCLMVMGADVELDHLVDYSLQATAAQLLCNWDITLLLRRTGDDAYDFDNLRYLRSEIDMINQRVESHQERLSLTANPEAAPLRLLRAPLLYENKEELERLVTGWLAMNFASSQSASHLKASPSDSRPPFGNIWFHGHGRTRVDVARISPQLAVTHDSWLDVGELEKTIMHRFQAPVWINLDLCRNKVRGKIEESTPTSKDVEELEPRSYENISEFDSSTQDFISELENQRSKLTAGYLIASAQADVGVTKLFPTNRTSSIDNDSGSLLATATAELLMQETSGSDESRWVFSNWDANSSTVTLRQQNEFTRRFFREQDPDSVQEPLLSPGTVSDQLVVYSTQPLVYSPQYVNLLRGGVTKFLGGFYSPELDNRFTSYTDAVTIVRQQDAPSGEFNYVLQFSEPVSLDATVPHQLVLLVSGESAVENDSIPFITGVYAYTNGAANYGGRMAVNSNFSNYNNVESKVAPIACDGSIRVIHTRLDQLKGAANSVGRCEISEIEIQAPPDRPHHWEVDSSLKIHGAFLLPENVTDDDLRAELQRAQLAPTLLAMSYWMLPFHDNPDKVSVHLLDSNVALLQQAQEEHAGIWGVAGQVYPKFLVSPQKRQLRIRVKALDDVDSSAEIFVMLNSGDRIIAAWHSSLQAVDGNDVPISLDDEGIAEEIIIAVRNYPGAFSIERLELEKLAQPK
ncbi:MAG: hypothetical protein J0M26_26695 [Planctomycetes bacterium]|nr:hypothetical protein [Planctomycetota bacterium]